MKFLVKYFDEIVSGLALAVVLICVVINVLLRYLFSISIEWLGEIATISFAWAVFVGASACYKRKMHIGIDVVVNLLPKGIQRLMEIFINAVLVVINIYVFYLSIIFSIGAWGRPTPILGLPYTLADLSLTVGFGFMTVFAIRDFINSIKSNSEQASSQV